MLSREVAKDDFEPMELIENNWATIQIEVMMLELEACEIDIIPVDSLLSHLSEIPVYHSYHPIA